MILVGLVLLQFGYMFGVSYEVPKVISNDADVLFSEIIHYYLIDVYESDFGFFWA